MDERTKGIVAVSIIAVLVLTVAYVLLMHDNNTQFVDKYRGSWELTHCTFGMKSEFGFHSCIEEDEWYKEIIGTEFEGFNHKNMNGYGLYISERNTEKLGWHDYDYFIEFQKHDECTVRETWIPTANQTNFNIDDGFCSENRITYANVDVIDERYTYSYTKGKVIEVKWNGNFEIMLESGKHFSFPEKKDIQLDDVITLEHETYTEVCDIVEFDVRNIGSFSRETHENLVEIWRERVIPEIYQTNDDWEEYRHQIRYCEHSSTTVTIHEVNGVKQY